MSDELYIARETDVDAIASLWAEAENGTSHVLRLQAPFGGGRRAAVSEFLRKSGLTPDDALIWRVNCLDQENGLQWLVRMYGSLVANLTSDVLRRGKIEMLLNAQLPQQPSRVQGWYKAFISSLKDSEHDKSKGQVKLQLPKDNPLIALVEIVAAIGRKQPVFLELQNPQQVNSLLLSAFVEALLRESREHDGKVMVVLFDEVETDTTKALYPMPLLDFYDRSASMITTHAIAPWGATEVEKFLATKNLTANAARLAEIAGGRPGFVAELVEILEENGTLGGDLSEITLASLMPITPDEDELEVPEGPAKEGERTHATAADAPRIAFLAALLGQAFPSSLVADMGGFTRESIDDMFDALGDLFEEVQYQEDLGTWIYKFKRGSWREGVLELNDNDEGRELARRVGMFMERFLVPRGYGFIVKTARVYAENGAAQRAALMRSIALTNDAPDTWGLCYDFTKYFDEIAWPDALRRTVYMNLLDRMVASGPLQAADQVHTEVTEWATNNEDREMTAWLLYAGSRLDTRRQDLYRARDRANDALNLYKALENNGRVAEVHNHIAAIELQDGNPNAALEQVNHALEAGQVEGPDGQKGVVPGVMANAEYVRGLVLRRSGKPVEAAEHFKRSNEISGNVGLGALALDSGLAYGEALLASGQTNNAAEVLRRVVQIAQQLRNPVRERNACELLAQAEGSQKNFEAATQYAARTLQLSQALKFEQALPIDLYNLGFFHYANQKPTEALTFFKQSAQRIGALGKHPVVKELYYFMGMAHLRAGNVAEAKSSLQSGLQPIKEAKDWRKMVSSLDQLASIEHQQGNTPVAKKLLADAITFAQQGGLKDERKSLKKKLDAIA